MADPAHILFDMSWPEVKEALKDIKVAIIPVGSCEQHGPNGTFEVDSARAYEFSKRLAARTYPIGITVPPIYYGVSTHHMRFPGTISASPETLISLAMDVVDSLYHHGIKKFFFLNGHGGNNPPLTVAINKIRHKYPDSAAALASPTSAAADVIKERVKSPITGHACESEMSQCLYLAPRCVKHDTLTPGTIRLTTDEYKNPYGVVVARLWHEVSENGALGDARQSSYELGEIAIETALDRLSAFVKDFAK